MSRAALRTLNDAAGQSAFPSRDGSFLPPTRYTHDVHDTLCCFVEKQPTSISSSI